MALLLGLLCVSCTAPEVTVLDPALRELVPVGARIEKLAGGFGFVEGPVWLPDAQGGALVFSDLPGNAVRRWRPDGRLDVVRDLDETRSVRFDFDDLLVVHAA